VTRNRYSCAIGFAPPERLPAEIQRTTIVSGFIPRVASNARPLSATMLEKNDQWGQIRHSMPPEGLEAWAEHGPIELSAVSRWMSSASQMFRAVDPRHAPGQHRFIPVGC